MTSHSLQVNFERLQADIETLGSIGRREDHGLYRCAFSEADWVAREWLQGRIQEAGLELYVDGAANIHARFNWDGERPSVMIGSHIDTVPGAGHLDGALGVMAGLECLRRLKELNLPLHYAVEALALTDEEGRFGGMLGSQAISGHLTSETIHNTRDLDGIALTEAMSAHGLNPMDILRARRKPESLLAFLELHIEQGPVLDQRGISIGIVEGIVGLFKWDITLKGVANHAGTTPMDMRQDAFQGLAEFAGEISRILEENGSPRSVATIGRVELFPGAANVIPGSVKFSLDVRDTEAAALKDLANLFRRVLSTIARRRELMFEFEVLSEIEPIKCDTGIMDTIHKAAHDLGISPLKMSSGAAHDTQIMATFTRAGMIFVPSRAGRSHSPAEWTDWEDIQAGANVALNTLYQLSR